MKRTYFAITTILLSSLLLSNGLFLGFSNMDAAVNDDNGTLFINSGTTKTISGYRIGFQRKAKGGSISGIGLTQRGFQWTDNEDALLGNGVAEYTFNYVNSFFSIPVIKFSSFVIYMGLEGSYLLSGTYRNGSVSGDIVDGFPGDLADAYSTSLYDFGPTVSILYHSIRRISFQGSYYHGMNNIIKSDDGNVVSLFSRNVQLDIIFNLNKRNKSKKTRKGKIRKPFGG